MAPTPSLSLLHSWVETSVAAPHLDVGAAATAGRTAVDLLASAVSASSETVLDAKAIRLMEVRSFIDGHLGQAGLSIEDIAAASAISVRYLHQLFRGTGESCRQYILRRRLEEAHSQLAARPERAITAIAAGCGFSTPSAFSRAYREAYGVTPRDARARAGS
ncbi:helix-turn-helix transcriptional regulator [Nesterenkonia cremea]|uniref:helix-turn-helix transcriptional regulator n=1 Tax=Nesterenkonia cremea TaxID=1882340 RepID=UPI00166C6101|nr:helix-turn-helix transcriptional regulator [Nesterenkonia cremea]